MATLTQTSTAIELQEHPGEGRQLKHPEPPASSLAPQDEAMQVSIAADSEVPDGGQGWVVMAGCAVVTWWFIGTSYCWGVLQAALVKDGLSSSSTLSFVGSLATACISFLGIINARVIRKLGLRKSALCGIFFVGLGEIISGFATHNVGALFVTAGVVMGLGNRYSASPTATSCAIEGSNSKCSLCFMVVSIVPSQYFKAKRGIATGIVYAAGGLGGAAISFIINAFLDKMGTAWTFRILGFITLGSGLPAAYLIKQRVPIHPTKFIEWYVHCSYGTYIYIYI